MSDKLPVAGFQIDVVFGDPAENLGRMDRRLRELAGEGLFLAVFPECSLSGYCCDSRDEAASIARPRTDPLVASAADLAKRHDVNLVFGFLELDDGEIYNAAMLATRDGRQHVYRKVHLPKLGVDQFATPGSAFQVVDVEGTRIGVNICYDCSFPEPARVLSLAGADLIVLPTNWPPGSGATADYIPNARALENNVWYMAINRVGEEKGFRFIGKSKICHPDGHDLAFANHDGEAILRAEIDPSVARQKHLVRVPGKHEIDRMADRRPETYTAITDANRVQ